MAADGAAGALELESQAFGFRFARDSDKYSAYGLTSHSSGRAGNSGYSDTVVGFGDFTDVLG